VWEFGLLSAQLIQIKTASIDPTSVVRGKRATTMTTMTFPTAVAFHGIESPEALRADVLDRVGGLERLLDDVLACRVLVEADSPWRQQDRHYGVFVRVTMPCIEFEAGGNANADPAHQDPYLAIDDTFDSLTRRIEDFVRRRCRYCTRFVKQPGSAA